MQLKTMNAYSDKVTTDNYAKQVIKLPVTKFGAPDWMYMENHIKIMPYNLEQLLAIKWFNIGMTETNRIEYKRELTSELDIEKEVVAIQVFMCIRWW